MGRIVGRVHPVELIAPHAGVLVEQAARLAARQRKAPRHTQRQVALGAELGGARRPAERADDGFQLECGRHAGAAEPVWMTVKVLLDTNRSSA